jgi:ABC-2 type transport system ATP-binding protein
MALLALDPSREASLRRGAVAQLEQVSRRYGDTVALDNVDLELLPGEVLGLLGPNGAGKTTAVAILLGLRVPDSGRAVLFGRDPRSPHARRRVGVVLQDVGFPETLRVREVVDLVRAHYPEPAPRSELLERFGLCELTDRQAGGLSGGERRRLAVALALLGRPQALVLDEPTAGLDVAARRELWRELRQFVADGGSVLLTTHQLDEAERFATRLILLVRGKIEMTGTVGEVRARAGLSRVSLRADRLPLLAAATEIESELDRHVIYTRDADAVVAALARAGVPLRELEVAALSLEEAFLAVTERSR